MWLWSCHPGCWGQRAAQPLALRVCATVAREPPTHSELEKAATCCQGAKMNERQEAGWKAQGVSAGGLEPHTSRTSTSTLQWTVPSPISSLLRGQPSSPGSHTFPVLWEAPGPQLTLMVLCLSVSMFLSFFVSISFSVSVFLCLSFCLILSLFFPVCLCLSVAPNHVPIQLPTHYSHRQPDSLLLVQV